MRSTGWIHIKCLRDCVALLCETEVVLFNADHSIFKIHGVTEISNGITEYDGRIFVELEDGMQEIVE